MKEVVSGTVIAALCAATLFFSLLGMAEQPSPTNADCDVQTALEAEGC